MGIASYDHVALPTRQPEAIMRFYRAIGFDTPDPETWADLGHTFFSVTRGDMRMNFHAPALFENSDFDLRGPTAEPGCGDICFVWDGTVEQVLSLLAEAGIEVAAGPVEMIGGRAGGTGQGQSVYTRDPDRNLIEFIVYDR